MNEQRSLPKDASKLGDHGVHGLQSTYMHWSEELGFETRAKPTRVVASMFQRCLGQS